MPYTVTKLPKREEDEEESPRKFTINKLPEEPPTGKQVARGAAQGGLDLLSFASLPLYPIEKAGQKLFGVESDPDRILPGAQERFTAQSNILDKMQGGQTPSIGELMMLSDDDDILPMAGGAGTSVANINRIQEEIPEGGLVQESVRRGARSLPWLLGGTGALTTALGGEFTGMAAKEGVKALGGGEGAQTIADIVGGLGYNLLPRAGNAAKKVPFIAQGQGTMAKIETTASPKIIEKRLLGLNNDIIQEADKRMSNISQQTLSDFDTFSARQTEDLIVKANRDSLLNRVAPIEKLPQQAWKDIGKEANDLYNAERKVYSNIYDGVRKAAKNIEHNPTAAQDLALQQINKIMNIETSPTGYAQVENLLKQIRRDLGISTKVVKDPNTGQEVLTQVIKPVSADKLMDLGVRIGDAINYEALTPSIKDLLKPVQRAVKEEFRQSLKQKPSALQGFNKAEDLYKKTANKFGKDVINKLRTTEIPENLGNDFLNPSHFENLVKVFGQNNKSIADAERQLVDLIARQGQKTGQETLRQLDPFLSSNAKSAAKEFVDLGDKLTVPGQRRLMQQNMLSDVSEAISTGNRPEFTLKAMRTPSGYEAAKNALARTQQGRKLFKVLEKQVVEDLFNSVTKDGVIDWNKAKKILNDTGYETVMNQILGIDGVQLIKNIEKYSNNITNNLMNAKISDPSTFGKFYNLLNSPAKLALTAFFGAKLGILMGIGGVAGVEALRRYGAQLITSPKVREVIKSMANPSVSGKELLKVPLIINNAVETNKPSFEIN